MTAYKTIIARNGATTMLATVEEDGGVYERLNWDAEACLSIGDAWDSLGELARQGWQWQPCTLLEFSPPAQNMVAGEGAACHEVPTVAMDTVHIGDDDQAGTLVCKLADGSFAFTSLDAGEAEVYQHAALVQVHGDLKAFVASFDVAGCAVEEVALAMVGYNDGEALEGWGDDISVIWRSDDAAETANQTDAAARTFWAARGIDPVWRD